METGVRLEYHIRRGAERNSLWSRPHGFSYLYRGGQNEYRNQLRRAKGALFRPVGLALQEEQAEAFKTFLAYAGRYTFSGDKVTHHVEISSIQNYVNKDLVRSVKFEGDRIALVTPPTPVNGEIQTVELIWQRLPAGS